MILRKRGRQVRESWFCFTASLYIYSFFIGASRRAFNLLFFWKKKITSEYGRAFFAHVRIRVVFYGTFRAREKEFCVMVFRTRAWEREWRGEGALTCRVVFGFMILPIFFIPKFFITAMKYWKIAMCVYFFVIGSCFFVNTAMNMRFCFERSFYRVHILWLMRR